MKSVLLYYPFQMAKNANSGSKLRPIEMYNAFRQWGVKNNIEILLLSGNSIERESLFKNWLKSGKLDNLLFCYMENQTIPLWLTDQGHIPKRPLIDLQVMKYLKKLNIPVGVFYRDVYWKFDDLYPLKGPKKLVMQSIYKMEEKFYEKYCQVIFLPSDAMGNYVDIKSKKVALPPGGKERGQLTEQLNNNNPKKGLYVGGINNEDYGLFLLLDAIKKANSEEEVCKLTIVCREDEFQTLPEEKKGLLRDLNVDVKHLSGKDLDLVYTEMDFAFIPRYKSTYNDFSVPVKLVEYLSNGLPVVATNCDAQREIIESGEYGLICEDEVDSMSEAIQSMSKKATCFRDNIARTFLDNHSWFARVEKIKNELVRENL